MDERISLIMDYQSAHWTVIELCLKYGITRQTTACKYIERFDVLGEQGLMDLPSAPHKVANKTPESIEKAIIELRRNHPRYALKNY